MPNTSATGGYLAPAVSTPPTEDRDLDRQIQQLVVGITGLNGTLVRPRWQPQNQLPKLPEATVNWCAIGVVSITPDANAAIVHRSPAGSDGYDEMQRHEIIEILCSFYGPAGQGYAALLRDGLSIAQNREALFLENMGLYDTGQIVTAPDLMNQQWIRRYDLTVRLRRQVVRTYPVENLLSAVGTIHTESLNEDFNTETPAHG